MALLTKSLSILFLFLNITNAIGQFNNDNFLKLIENNKVEKREYLDKMDIWVDKEFSAGRTFSREELTEHLKTYLALTQKHKEFYLYKINYYIKLANNAQYANRNGECFYFLEKAEKEIFKLFKQRSLIVSARKINVYLENRNYKKVVDTYRKNRSYLNTLPQLIKDKALNLNISIEYISLFNPAMEACVEIGNIKEADSVFALSERIYAELKQKLPQDNLQAQYVNFYQAHIRYQYSLNGVFKKDKALQALNEMKLAVNSEFVNANEINNDIRSKYYLSKAKYYLRVGIKDSTNSYLDSLRNVPFLNEEQHYEANALTTLIAEKEGNYYKAYNEMKKVAISSDSLRALLVDDIDKLIYAHTESEVNRELLRVSEEKENTRNLWIICLISIFIIVGTLVYIIIKRREKASKKRIEELNTEVNLQISIMEERLAFVRRDEKKRLAQDLHDSFSSKIASVKQRLTILQNENMSAEQIENVDVLINISNELYDESRKHSHNLYTEDFISDDKTYIENLMKIIKYALPKNRYETEINIDPGALDKITLEIRIQLIYIFQEILTNIIKHAKAKKIQIAIYKEDNKLNILIEDNGKGFNENKKLKQGIGFKSIQNRLENINGKLTISSNSTNTSIFIEILGV
ncbi:sensor histidine kinase [Sphingobacterium sp. 2149]|uniref:sensor histidine kinase n=1 Tax=Sphingobacterium sp. 2149 TaxID=2817763 RepID=UPI001AEB5F57|nr:ATP-binding protein [Sphingobacterium sp. 2149]MDR6736228.1 signal transduction histidine kinase [Sphingobacterium sp. 2149]